MSRLLTHPSVILLARWGLGLTFLYASLGKIGNPARFAQEVGNYDFLPESLVTIFALTLPWVEFLAGLCLLVGLRTRAAALLVAIMNVMFIIALAQAKARGLNVNCGCFSHGGEVEPVGWGIILRDVGLFALCLPIWFGNDTLLRLDAGGPSRPQADAGAAAPSVED